LVQELVANNLGDTLTHALAFVYGWGVSDLLKWGDPDPEDAEVSGSLEDESKLEPAKSD
jgi:hypothetical protein